MGNTSIKPIKVDKEEAIKWLKDDIRIHKEWEEWTRKNPNNPLVNNVGDHLHHKMWAERYEGIIELIKQTNENS